MKDLPTCITMAKPQIILLGYLYLLNLYQAEGLPTHHLYFLEFTIEIFNTLLMTIHDLHHKCESNTSH